MSKLPAAQDSHYARIGGAPAVTVAVEQFYQRLQRDPSVCGFFTSMNLDALQQHQVLFLSQLLGGPEKYTGRTLARAHASLGITAKQFDIVGEHLLTVLEELSVPQDTVAAVRRALSDVAPDIVTGPASEGN
ncbi:MAG: group I truncated hemoglobin [Angustibacter sp.]